MVCLTNLGPCSRSHSYTLQVDYKGGSCHSCHSMISCRWAIEARPCYLVLQCGNRPKTVYLMMQGCRDDVPHFQERVLEQLLKHDKQLIRPQHYCELNINQFQHYVFIRSVDRLLQQEMMFYKNCNSHNNNSSCFTAGDPNLSLGSLILSPTGGTRRGRGSNSQLPFPALLAGLWNKDSPSG